MSGDWSKQVEVLVAAVLEVAPKFLSVVHPAALEAKCQSASFGISMTPAQLRLLQSAEEVAMGMMQGAPAASTGVVREAAPAATVQLTPFQAEVMKELEEIGAMLVAKNAAYGDSALSPLRVFGSASPRDLLAARIDDKLSRLARGSAAGEDTVLDLIGYLVLWRIALHREQRGRMAHGAAGESLTV